MIDVEHSWGRWGNILVLILCIKFFSLFFDTCHFPIQQTLKKFWNLLAPLYDLLIAKILGWFRESVLVVWFCTFSPRALLWRFMFLSRRYVDKIENYRGKQRNMSCSYGFMTCGIIVHHMHPYQLHDDCTRSLIFILIFKVFLLQL